MFRKYTFDICLIQTELFGDDSFTKQWNSKCNIKLAYMKMHLKIASSKRRPFCAGLNVLKTTIPYLDDLAYQLW